MQKLIVHLTYKVLAFDFREAYEYSFGNLYEKYDIQHVVLYEDIEEEQSWIREDLGIFRMSYQKDSLTDRVGELHQKYDVVYMNTFTEQFITQLQILRKEFGHAHTPDLDIFNNKTLQRAKIREHAPEYSLQFFELELGNFDIDTIESQISYPFIVKPTFGGSSSGVVKIQQRSDLELYKKNVHHLCANLKKRGYDSFRFLFEQLLEGDMFVIDYFVDSAGNISQAQPVSTRLLKDIYDIDDMGLGVERLGPDIEEKLADQDIDRFIQKHVDACTVRNTFIHHEFFLTKDGLRTIEMNGRIGGARIDMYRGTYGVNLMELCVSDDIVFENGKYYLRMFIFPDHDNTKPFVGLKESFIETFQKMPGFYKFSLNSQKLGKSAGFSISGYGYVGNIHFVHEDKDVIHEAFLYIKKHLHASMLYDENGL